jgi:hypothetical protein
MADFKYKIPGKYRRAFSWRVSDANSNSVQSDLKGMFRLATSDFPDILEDSIEAETNEAIDRATATDSHDRGTAGARTSGGITKRPSRLV